MDTAEKIKLMQQSLGSAGQQFKTLKKDGSLIERIDKTILTEDNREVLFG